MKPSRHLKNVKSHVQKMRIQHCKLDFTGKRLPAPVPTSHLECETYRWVLFLSGDLSRLINELACTREQLVQTEGRNNGATDIKEREAAQEGELARLKEDLARLSF